jgi:hypothetical protein
MTLLLIDGADDGLSAYKWHTSVLPVTTQQRTGTASLQVGNFPPGFTMSAAERHSTMVLGFAHMATVNEACDICAFRGSAGSDHVLITRTAVNEIVAKVGASTVATSAVGQLVAGTWKHIEVKVVVADVAGRIIVKVNGVLVIDYTGDTRNGQADADVYSVAIFRSGGVSDFYVDDVFLLNGAGTVNNDMLGDCVVNTIYPDGNGNYSQGAGSDGNSVDNYLLVDEPNAPNTSDYVSLVATGDKDSYTFGNVAAGTIFGIAQRASAAKSDAGSRTMRNFQRIAGVDYPSAVDQGLSVTPTYIGISDLIEVSPATGVFWTTAEINAAEFGVEARA